MFRAATNRVFDWRACLRVSVELNSCASMNGSSCLEARIFRLLYWFGTAVSGGASDNLAEVWH